MSLIQKVTTIAALLEQGGPVVKSGVSLTALFGQAPDRVDWVWVDDGRESELGLLRRRDFDGQSESPPYAGKIGAYVKAKLPLKQHTLSLSEALEEFAAAGNPEFLPVNDRDGRIKTLYLNKLQAACASELRRLGAKIPVLTSECERQRQRETALRHEIRTALAGIESQCDEILWQYSQAPYLVEKQKRIRKHGDAIATAIGGKSGAPNLAKPLVLRRRLVDLPRFLNGAAAELQTVAGTRGIRLVLDVSAAVEVTIDPEMLGPVLFGLLQDSLRASKSGTTITMLSTYEEIADDQAKDGQVRLVITDTGAGFASVTSLATYESRLEKREGAVANAALSGDILCPDHLDYARSVLELHGGSLHVDKAHRGVQIEVVLPGARLIPQASDKPVVLVVEDDIDLQEYLCSILREGGFQPVAVNDGFDALIVIERLRPRLVMTDIMMPNMDGIDLTARIKKSAMNLPVIIFSGLHDRMPLFKHSEYLPDLMLRKPLNQAAVLEAVEAMTQR